MSVRPESLIHPDETPEQFMTSNHAAVSWSDQSRLSFPDLSSAEIDLESGTTLRFVFWVHAVGNEQSVIPLIEGSDILVLEAVYRGVHKNIIERQAYERKRQLNTDMVSILVSGQADPAAVRRLRRQGYDAESLVEISGWEEERDKLIRKAVIQPQSEILTHYGGQLQKVFFADVGAGEAERLAAIKDEGDQKHAIFHQALEDADASWAEINEYAIDLFKARGKENAFREGVAAKQLEQIARKNPGSTIAVLYGVGHQLLTRMIEAPGVRLQRQFAAYTKSIRDEPIHIRLSELHMGIENSLRGGAFDQSYLDQFLVLVIASGLGDEQMNRSLLKLSPTELSRIASKLGKLWEERIDYDGDYDYEDLDDLEPIIQQRREQTKRILGSQSTARKMFRLLGLDG